MPKLLKGGHELTLVANSNHLAEPIIRGSSPGAYVTRYRLKFARAWVSE